MNPAKLTWPVDWTYTGIGLSQSLISCWLECKRKFLFKLNGYYDPKKEEKCNFGNICHEVNDYVYTRGKYPESSEINSCINLYVEKRIKQDSAVPYEQMETDAAKAEATLAAYFAFYKNDFKSRRFYDAESIFSNIYNGIRCRGKIDLKYRTKQGKKWLKEHKTKGRIDENAILLHLPLMGQNNFYILNDYIDTGEYAEGITFNVIRQTGIKRGKNERLRTYKNRVLASICKDPQHSFKRWESPFDKDHFDAFCTSLGKILYQIQFESGLEVEHNPFACTSPFNCEFLKACNCGSCDCMPRRKITAIERLFPELELKQEEQNARKKSKIKETTARITAQRRRLVTRKKKK